MMRKKSAPHHPIPHCDSSVLHRPGSCEYCDHHPEWQAYRMVARINYTGEDDPDAAPCPSTYFRSSNTVDRWYGNQAEPPDTFLLQQVQAAKEQTEKWIE